MHVKAPFDCSRATQGHNLRIIMTSVRRRTFLLQVVALPGGGHCNNMEIEMF